MNKVKGKREQHDFWVQPTALDEAATSFGTGIWEKPLETRGEDRLQGFLLIKKFFCSSCSSGWWGVWAAPVREKGALGGGGQVISSKKTPFGRTTMLGKVSGKKALG